MQKFKKIFLIFILVIIFFASNSISTIISDKLRNHAQNNEKFYELMIHYDAYTFLTTGGDSFTYNNYFKWQYAHMLQSSNTPIIFKFLFWDTGIFYNASNPPANYKYPTQFKTPQETT